MSNDPLRRAKALVAAGQPADAIDHAWRAVIPAVIDHKRAVLADAATLAQEVADSTSGGTRADALSLVVYCTECLHTPRDGLLDGFSFKGIFTRRSRPTRRCPDCAEDIAAEAKVCRFCGYRFAESP